MFQHDSPRDSDKIVLSLADLVDLNPKKMKGVMPHPLRIKGGRLYPKELPVNHKPFDT